MHHSIIQLLFIYNKINKIKYTSSFFLILFIVTPIIYYLIPKNIFVKFEKS